MAKKLSNGRFACTVCGKSNFTSPQHADACRDSHNILYIPIEKSDLNLLINAIILENFNLVPQNVLNTFRRYAQKAALENDVNSNK